MHVWGFPGLVRLSSLWCSLCRPLRPYGLVPLPVVPSPGVRQHPPEIRPDPSLHSDVFRAMEKDPSLSDLTSRDFG